MSDPLSLAPKSQPATPMPRSDSTGAETPRPLDVLVGREDDVRRFMALLDEPIVRLLTLTGPGGVGKTRLALEVIARVKGDFADGAVFLPLASIRDASLVPTAVARACGIAAPGNATVAAVLTQWLRDRHVLLVLDNFEHLLDTDPARLTDVLGACPLVTVLITSRTALNAAGEQRYLVPPLQVPANGREWLESAATVLFAQRAREVRPDFSVTPENQNDIGNLCRRLDGLPLAIELAAARVTVMTPAVMAQRLQDRFALLRGGQRNAPVRLRSLHDAIAWSYELLSPSEQQAYRQLSIFVGGFTLDAAEAVVRFPDDMQGSVVDVLASLVDKSHLQPVAHAEGDPRFTMLETIREFGLAKLAASSEKSEVRQRHAEWCLALAKDLRADPSVIIDPWAIDRLDREHANIQATLIWLDQSGQAGQLLGLMNDLQHFWNFGGHDVEGLTWYKRALEEPRNGSPSERLDALAAAGTLAHAVDDPVADSYIEQAVALAGESGTLAQRANAISVAAIRAEDLGDYARAEGLLQEAREYANRAALTNVSIMIDYHLGIVAYGQGHSDLAVERLEGARQAAIAIGETFVPLWSLVHLALIACDRGDQLAAADLLRQHPDLDRAGYHQHLPLLRAAAGVLAADLGHHEMAACLLGSTAHDVGLFYPERIIIERTIERTRQQLGEEQFPDVWEAGRRLQQHEVENEIHRLLSVDADWTLPPKPSPGAESGLSPRELEVLRLLADGHTSQQVADTLFLSRRTVDNHVANILGKLDVGSRTAAVAYAIRNNLV